MRREPAAIPSPVKRTPYVSRAGSVMDNSSTPPAPDDRIPLGQRLFDNVFLLLAAGLVIMFLLYTGWGFWEITSLPTGRLP